MRSSPAARARKCQRHQPLAICPFGASQCILSCDNNRAFVLIRHRRIVNGQHPVLAADKPVRLIDQFRFQQCRVPDTIGDERVQLIVISGSQSASPSFECACAHQGRLAPQCNADTFAAGTCDPGDPGMASANTRAGLPNPLLRSHDRSSKSRGP